MRLPGLILSAVLLTGSLWAGAQPVKSDTLSVRLAFPRGVSVLMRNFDDNGTRIDAFLHGLNGINAQSDIMIHSVNITAAASVEGIWQQNERLSHDRARSILDMILDGTTLSASQIKISSIGENWKGLRSILEEHDAPWRNDALAIVESSGVLQSADSISSVRCKDLLKVLDGGRAWQWMQENAFPVLRSAAGSVTVVTMPYAAKERSTVVILHQKTVVHHIDSTGPGSTEHHHSVDGKPVFKNDSLFREPVMAIRSNLLLPLMNIGVEIPLSNRFSIGADWYSPWVVRRWMNGLLPSQMYCVQALAGSLEARWWLGRIHRMDADSRYRLRGHSIAIAAMGGYYDFERDGHGRQGEFCGLGVDWTYALPLGRGGVHLEFSIGAAALWNTYRDYRVYSEGGYLTADGSRTSRIIPVPFRTGISLCVPVTKSMEGAR